MFDGVWGTWARCREWARLGCLYASETTLTGNVAAGEETDRALVGRMARGDDRALGDLYDRYAPRLFSLALRMLGERADAEEVVLEAFTQAWRAGGNYDAARGSVGAWLTIMVRSRTRDLGRSRRRREGVATRGNPEETAGISVQRDDPSQAPEVTEQRRTVGRALQDLSDAQRTAIELAYYEGLTHSEIAARLDTPVGTVKTRIRDGMGKLRSVLRPLYAGHGT